ncbi:cytochrome P450 [Colletotrichum cereale]|nr:cytochrome P450 [Colletotrichum cereale]
MVTLRMGSKTWVMLKSGRVVSEIIAKRGQITNERPRMSVLSDLRTVIWQQREWREGRHVMHQLLGGSNLKVYTGIQVPKSLDVLRRYLRESKIVMGYPLNMTKAQVDDYQRVTMEFVTVTPSSPIFYSPWRRIWAHTGSFHRRVFYEWWKPIKTAVSNGSAPPSFLRDVLLHLDVRFAVDDEEAMYLATSVMAAGGDTTRMTINVFTMTMVTRPEAQLRAREDVNRVCMNGESLRFPRMSDLPAMPYVAAMIKEVQRWRPIVPIVPSHQLSEDLEFDGHFRPPSTCFMINSIGLSSEFDNADAWKVAEQALFISFDRLLYCFELSTNGLINDERLNHQAINEPFPLKVAIRRSRHASLIKEEASKYEASFSTFGAK